MVELAFAPDVDRRLRARIDHAFATFRAVFGYPRGGASVRYGVDLPAGYRPRDLGEAAPVPDRLPVPGLDIPGGFPRFHPPGEGSIDWLGEIFEWLSGQEERGSAARDGVGRVPFAATLNGRFDLDPERPWAALAMAGLNFALRPMLGEAWLPAPRSPWPDGAFVVQASHDVDVLPVSPAATAWRLAKNAGMALLDRDPAQAFGITLAAARDLWSGAGALDGLRRLLELERRRGVSADYNVLWRRAHRRDAGYRPQGARAARLLRRIPAAGGVIGVHGSYRSLERSGGLAAEYALARRHHPVDGGRQHWLRWSGDRLFDALVAAGARWDGSIGFPDRPGFRWGACFPFAPYDFRRERAYPILELPLIIMDSALLAQPEPAAAVERVLATARRWGWGGCGLLWHDPVTGGSQLPMAIGRCYERALDQVDAARSGSEIAAGLAARYAAAGALAPRNRG